MTTENQIPQIFQNILAQSAEVSPQSWVRLAKNPLVRKWVTAELEKNMLHGLSTALDDPAKLPGVEADRTLMGLAIMGSIERGLAQKTLSDRTVRAILQILVQTLLVEGGDRAVVDRFSADHGMRSPSFLLLSPGKACNLRCTGCYADSTDKPRTLEWSILDRIVEEAKTLWGDRFFVISGGEPFAYRSEGKGILDLVEKHPDCIFMAYTNGTLIGPKESQRIAQAGNFLLCISVEGWKERTDARRGAGMFERIHQTMHLLRQNGIPFGISLTGTRENAEEILSDEFIDHFIQEGALFGWLFQYMPIGRSFTLDLMPTPQQRTWMWRRSWEVIREKRFFLADFWNHGTTCDGCLSAGGHGAGGYFYIDWNGAVSPCVFMPYSPVNIHDVYARGGTLNNVWEDPFFAALRRWQLDYKAQNRNGLAPCPNRDHHDELETLIRQYEPEPTDANAAETLTDPGYTRGLTHYSQTFQSLTGPIWSSEYIHRKVDVKTLTTADRPPIPTLESADSLEAVDSPEAAAVP